MMAESKLAEMVVEFATKGAEKIDGAITKITGGLTRADALVSSRVSRLTSQLTNMGNIGFTAFRKIGAGASFALNAIGAGFGSLRKGIQGLSDKLLSGGPLGILELPNKFVSSAANAVSAGFSALGGFVSSITAKAGLALGGIAESFGSVFQLIPLIGGALGGVLGGIGKAAGAVLGLFGEIAGAAIGIVGQAIGTIGSIPGLLVGGINAALNTFSQGLKKITSVAARVFAITAGAIGVFTRAALSGTTEGDRLAASWNRLSVTIGAIFIPYVRLLTQAIDATEGAFSRLPEGTKSFIAQTGILIAAGAGAVAIFGQLATSAIALFNPVTIIGGALGYMAFQFLTAGTQGETWSETMTTVVERVIDLFNQFRAITDYVFPYVQEIFESVATNVSSYAVWLADNFQRLVTGMVEAGRFVAVGLANIGRAWREAQKDGFLGKVAFLEKLDETIEHNLGPKTLEVALKKMTGKLDKLPELVAPNFEKAGQEANAAWKKWMDRIGQNRGFAADLVGQIGNALKRFDGGNATRTLKLGISFESLDQSFERFQRDINTTINGGDQAKKEQEQIELLKDLRGALAKIEEAVRSNKPVPAVQ